MGMGQFRSAILVGCPISRYFEDPFLKGSWAQEDHEGDEAESDRSCDLKSQNLTIHCQKGLLKRSFSCLPRLCN